MRKIQYFVKKIYYKFFVSLECQAKLEGVNMGKNNFVDSRFWSSEPYLITIGDNCQITNGVKMFTHGGGQALRDKYPDFDVFGKIKIGNYVYLGSNTLVMPGITIEDNVLVASGSVVTKSLRAGGVYGGNPVKYLCSIEDYFERNKRYDLHSKKLSSDDKKKLLLSLSGDHFIKKGFIDI